MLRSTPLWSAVLVFVVGLISAAGSAIAAEAVSALRLYAADCGELDFKDMGFLSDAGDYDGRAGSIVVPCFIIRHPKGTLVWDAGLGDNLVGKPGNEINNGVRAVVRTTLVDQLRSIGLTPADFTYLAFSHLHLDHTGNANLFGSATWIMNRAELNAALNVPPPFAVVVSTFDGYKSAKRQMIDSDYDVFGDGTVVLMSAPGHTPGHQVLAVKLAKRGTVVLAGDLYHYPEERTTGRIPTFEYDADQSRAARAKIEQFLKDNKAELWIEHDIATHASLPRSPQYVE